MLPGIIIYFSAVPFFDGRVNPRRGQFIELSINKITSEYL